jgi:hypothetical protein
MQRIQKIKKRRKMEKKKEGRKYKNEFKQVQNSVQTLGCFNPVSYNP